MTKFAEGTSVDVEKSLSEIRKTLGRFGADAFGYLQEGETTRIMFAVRGLKVQMSVTNPDRSDFALTPAGRQRASGPAHEAWEQECRRKMRSLTAVIKAKLVAIDDGVATLEQEFLPYILTQNGVTVGELLIPRIQEAALSGRQLALPAIGSGKG